MTLRHRQVDGGTTVDVTATGTPPIVPTWGVDFTFGCRFNFSNTTNTSFSNASSLMIMRWGTSGNSNYRTMRMENNHGRSRDFYQFGGTSSYSGWLNSTGDDNDGNWHSYYITGEWVTSSKLRVTRYYDGVASAFVDHNGAIQSGAGSFLDVFLHNGSLYNSTILDAVSYAYWERKLDTETLARLDEGVSPSVFPQDLVMHYPCVRGPLVPNGLGATATSNGTLRVGDNPRMIF